MLQSSNGQFDWNRRRSWPWREDAINALADKRQARGIVSSGGLDGTPDQKRVDWTEAVDIFRTFGLVLNPKT